MPLAEAIPNPYQPSLVRIHDFSDETPDVRTLRLQFVDDAEAGAFAGWKPGQFGQFTVFGAGESVFALANAPWRPTDQKESVPTSTARGLVAKRRRSWEREVLPCLRTGQVPGRAADRAPAYQSTAL